MLLDHVASTGEAFRPPRAVYFHSDGLTARTRAALQSLGVPVFSTYEACEALKIGFECDAHQGYHVNIDTYPIRIVDGASRDLPAGGTGRVVVSNLSNRAMVLLNYELGDRATWLADRCRCGRTLPRLALLEGSPVESIKLPSGRTVSVIQIYRLFLGEPALREHQVVHVSPGHFRLLLVVPAVAEQAACGTRIAQAFRTLFADEASAEVVFLERIPLSRGGKKRSFVPLGG